MGTPCSCVSKTQHVEMCTVKAVRTRASPTRTVVGLEEEPQTVRTDLLAYFISNQKEMQSKLQVLFQRAISFPKEGLAVFHLSHCSLKDSDWAHFSTLVLYGQKATSLRIEQVLLTPAGLDFVCSYLEILRKLRELSLSGTGLGSYPLHPLASAISHFHRLYKLNLSDNELTAEHMEILCPALPSTLMQWELDHNELEDKGCAILSQFLPNLTALSELSLCENGITETGRLILQASIKSEQLQIWTDGPRRMEPRKELNSQ